MITIPLARLVDRLIARQQARTGRGGPGGGEAVEPALQPLTVGRADGSGPSRAMERGRILDDG